MGVFASKCCLRSFCDKCIREYIINKKICDYGATNVLADDLLPNKTLRYTINYIVESAMSSSENVGSLPCVQDMESAHHAQSKGPTPTKSAVSKNEHKHPPSDHSANVMKSDSRVCEDAKEGKVLEAGSRVEEDSSEVKDVNDESHHLNKMTTTDTDESKATPASTGPREAISPKNARLPEDIQQRILGREQGKKKTKQLLESG